MRLLIQRVKHAKVSIAGEEIGRIDHGLCLFLGIAKGDNAHDVIYLTEKVIDLRIFEDESGKLNQSLRERKGEILVVSEFTLCGDCSKGRRPSFSLAAPSEEAERFYRYFVHRLEESGIKIATGQFQARMEVTIVNDGPVTFILDSRKPNLR